jgi:GntR family transcriptional regulator/MocR family aminotransferase
MGANFDNLLEPILDPVRAMPLDRHAPPASSVVSDFVRRRFERKSPEPDTRQMFRILRLGILDGTLPTGFRLPPTRQLAGELEIARNTVIYVYEQLASEGYVRAGVGRGTYVSDTKPLGITPDAPARRGSLSQRGSGLSRRGVEIYGQAGASRQQWGAFVPGVPDVTEFPHAVWGRIARSLWRRPPPELLTYSVGPGHRPLREALVHYLRSAQDVQCEPDQLIITTGTHQSLHLLAHLLGDPGDVAWFEEPGYWGARSVLCATGIECRPIPVDDEGMNPRPEHLQPPPRFIFVSPSHQYPLGSVMSLARRRQLLEYARITGAWVVEDDYDSEFRYGGRPLASLQGLDRNEQVFYLGTLSKIVYPGLRIGYMVVPRDMVESFTVALADLYREGQLATQSILATFIEDGHFTSHIRRMRGIYGARRAKLIEAIGSQFGDRLEVIGSDAGLHLVLALPPHVDDRALVARAMDEGIATRPLSIFYKDRQNARGGLLLGYACVREQDIPVKFARLAQVIRSAL